MEINKKKMLKLSNSLYKKYRKTTQSGGENFIVSNTDIYNVNNLDYNKPYVFSPIDKLDSAMYSKFEV